jgi:hypothetical protein
MKKNDKPLTREEILNFLKKQGLFLDKKETEKSSYSGSFASVHDFIRMGFDNCKQSLD